MRAVAERTRELIPRAQAQLWLLLLLPGGGGRRGLTLQLLLEILLRASIPGGETATGHQRRAENIRTQGGASDPEELVGRAAETITECTGWACCIQLVLSSERDLLLLSRGVTGRVCTLGQYGIAATGL